jgi:anti-sigma factor RsiW
VPFAIVTTPGRNGYHLIHWTAGGMSLSAVSDVEPARLEQFVREWQRTP